MIWDSGADRDRLSRSQELYRKTEYVYIIRNAPLGFLALKGTPQHNPRDTTVNALVTNSLAAAGTRPLITNPSVADARVIALKMSAFHRKPRILYMNRNLSTQFFSERPIWKLVLRSPDDFSERVRYERCFLYCFVSN
jgi:hypothetical protein